MLETFLILDTETTIEGDNMPNQSVFDIGWVISNRKGETLVKRSYIVEEFKYQALHKKKAFLIDNGSVSVNTYFEKLLRKEMKVAKWQYIASQLVKDCNKYNVEYIGAYNLAFDSRVISKTHEFFQGKEFLLFEEKFLIDLWHTCAYTILNTDKYKAFAHEHGLFTDKGNFKTGAETTIQYILNDTSYIEEHTGLQDAIDETMILHHLLNNVDYIPLHAYTINSQSWRIVNAPKEEE